MADFDSLEEKLRILIRSRHEDTILSKSSKFILKILGLSALVLISYNIFNDIYETYQKKNEKALYDETYNSESKQEFLRRAEGYRNLCVLNK